MTLLEFIRDEAPKRCKVHPACGKIAEMVYYEELRNTGIFAADQFSGARERAAMALPFCPEDFEEYEKCLDVLELAILNHYVKHHKAEETRRMDFLKHNMRKEDVAVAEGDWWNY